MYTDCHYMKKPETVIDRAMVDMTGEHGKFQDPR